MITLVENGCRPSCAICGAVESLGKLSSSLFSVLARTGTISSETESSKLNLCSQCSPSAALMEQAARVQAKLSDKFRQRHRNGMNGMKTTSLTAQLVKSGNEVNMPGDVEVNTQWSDTDDSPQLMIGEVRGGLGMTIGSDMNNKLDSPLVDSVNDQADNAFLSFPHMECEVFPHTGVSHCLLSSDVSESSMESGAPDSTALFREETLQPSWGCPTCAIKFDSKQFMLAHHHNVHSRNGWTMMCPFCAKIFPAYTQLDDHIRQLHKEDGRHICLGCSIVFPQAASLRTHQQCCPHYVTSIEQNMATQMSIEDGQEHATEEPACAHCLVKLPDAERLTRHMKDCRTDCLSKKYNCEGCLGGHDLLESLFSHQMKCELFSRIGSMDSSLDYSLELRCQGCNSMYSNFTAFESHKEECVEIRNLLSIESSPLDSLDKCIPEKNLSSSSIASTDVVSPVDPPSSPNGLLSCAVCGIRYREQWQLDAHVEAVHRNASVCPLKCTGCRGGFCSIVSLNAHMQQCNQPFVKSHPCPKCLTQHEFKSILDFHMKIHENPDKQPFRCTGCQGGFEAQSDKLGHEEKCGKYKMMLIKNAGKRNKCAPMNYPTDVKSQPIERANTKDHVQQSFFCKRCAKQFTYFCDLEEHSCTPTVAVKEENKDISSVSSSGVEGNSVSPSHLLLNLDYLAAEIPCPICGIDLKSQRDDSPSASKVKATRHMFGHREDTVKRMSCPGCNWGSPSPSRPVFLNHTNHCLILKDMYPEVEFDDLVVRCPVCLVKSNSREECAGHFTKHHVISLQPLEFNFICDGCRGHFGSQVQLDSHKSECLLYPRTLVAAGIGTACGVCCTRFTKPEKCGAHILELHQILLNAVICVFCNVKFEALDDVITHVNTCCGLAQSIIKIKADRSNMIHASTSVSVKDATVENVKSDEAVTSLNCSDKESQRSESSQSSNGNECHICRAKLSGTAKTRKHALIHSEKDSRPYHCKGCGGGFLHIGSVIKHQPGCLRRNMQHAISPQRVKVESSTDMPTNIEISLKTGKGQVAFTCNACEEGFDSEDKLAEHVLSTHTITKHRCFYCDKEFTYEESLAEHNLYCNGGFTEPPTDPHQVIRHKTSTEDDEEVEEWKCLSCCIKFISEMAFLLHIASHEVTNVNRCSLCHAGFKSAADICMHMVKYHKEYLMTGVKGRSEDDDSDKDSDDDSDVEIQSTASKSTSQLTAPSPKSVRSRTPVRSTSGTLYEEQITNTPTKACDSKLSVADFNYERLVGKQCPVCNRTFSTNAILRRHYGIHDGYYTAVCLVCGQGFCKISLLRTHKAAVHRTPKVNDKVCPRCGGAFEQSYRLQKHLEICVCPRNDAVIQCVLCMRSFVSWQQEKSHSWTHLTKCSYCEDKYSQQSKRVNHMVSCAKNPLNNDTVSLSEAIANNAKAISLPKAASSLSKPAPQSKKALTEKKKYKCKECCSEYATMKSLKRHEVVHEHAEYRCRVCGGKFSSLLAKNKHILREHEFATKIIRAAPKLEPTVQPIINEEQVQKTIIMCNICKMLFDTQAGLDFHVRKEHGKMKEFTCSQCGKRFPSKFARRQHLKTAHTADHYQQSLACNICTKRFPSNFAKLQHMKKIHKMTDDELNPKKQKVCKICGESFEHKSDLKAHKRSAHARLSLNNNIDLDPDMILLDDEKPKEFVFTSPKTRACKLCDQTFAHKTELRAHIRAVHSLVSSQPSSFSDTQQHSWMIVNGSAHFPNPTTSVTSDMFVSESSDKSKVRVCKDCGRVFDSKNELKAHRKAEHKEKKIEMRISGGDTLQLFKPADHPLGGAVVIKEEYSPEKKRLKLAETTIQSNESINNTPVNLPFRCEHCDKSFKLRILLNRHHTKAHPWNP